MKSLGFFSEMKLYNDNGPIKEYIVDKVDYDKEAIIRYLNSFKELAICARRPIDCVTGEEIANGFRVITDGEYEWCDFLPYHIQKYNIMLPKNFVNKVMNIGERLEKNMSNM